jgi:putative transcriptional regulator
MARALILLIALLTLPAAAQQPDAPNSLLLVAKPGRLDPNFRESVVLVTQAPDSSTVGVILNRPSVERHAVTGEILYAGGPVMQGIIVALFRSDSAPAAPAFHVLRNIYLSMHPANLERVLAQPRGQDHRLYNGFAGWTPGQLQSEIANGGWHVLPTDEDVLFRADTAGLWQELHDRARGQRAQSAKAMRAAVD